jgi:hypothetical protein
MCKSIEAAACPVCGTVVETVELPELEPTSRPTPGLCGVRVEGGYCPHKPKKGKRCALHKGGRPTIYCCRGCGLFAANLSMLQDALGPIVQRATPEARSSLRQALWNLGNTVPTTLGRQPGTSYWELTLECGHTKDAKARSRQGPEGSELDPAPKTSRCPTCAAGNGNGAHRQRVVTSTLRET